MAALAGMFLIANQKQAHSNVSPTTISECERATVRTHTESDLGRRRDGAYYIEWHISSWRNKNYKRPPSRTLKILSLDMVKRLRCDAIRLPTVARLDLNIISCLSGKDCPESCCLCVSKLFYCWWRIYGRHELCGSSVNKNNARASEREKTAAAAGERRKIGTHQGVIAWHCERGSLDMVRCASRLYWSSPLPNYIYMRWLSLISACINVNGLGFGRLICHRMDAGIIISQSNGISLQKLMIFFLQGS